MLDVVLGRLTKFSTEVIRPFPASPNSPLVGGSGDGIAACGGDSETVSVSTPAM